MCAILGVYTEAVYLTCQSLVEADETSTSDVTLAAAGIIGVEIVFLALGVFRGIFLH